MSCIDMKYTSLLSVKHTHTLTHTHIYIYNIYNIHIYCVRVYDCLYMYVSMCMFGSAYEYYFSNHTCFQRTPPHADTHTHMYILINSDLFVCFHVRFMTWLRRRLAGADNFSAWSKWARDCSQDGILFGRCCHQ